LTYAPGITVITQSEILVESDPSVHEICESTSFTTQAPKLIDVTVSQLT